MLNYTCPHKLSAGRFKWSPASTIEQPIYVGLVFDYFNKVISNMKNEHDAVHDKMLLGPGVVKQIKLKLILYIP